MIIIAIYSGMTFGSVKAVSTSMMQSVTCIKPRVNMFISERKIAIKPKISYVKNGNGKIVSTLEMESP